MGSSGLAINCLVHLTHGGPGSEQAPPALWPPFSHTHQQELGKEVLLSLQGGNLSKEILSPLKPEDL